MWVWKLQKGYVQRPERECRLRCNAGREALMGWKAWGMKYFKKLSLHHFYGQAVIIKGSRISIWKTLYKLEGLHISLSTTTCYRQLNEFSSVTCGFRKNNSVKTVVRALRLWCVFGLKRVIENASFRKCIHDVDRA